MRFFIITALVLLTTPTAYAASPEECLNMARDYLVAADKNQSDTKMIYARETYLSHCKTSNPFNQKLTQLVVDNKVIKAIDVRQNTKRKYAKLSVM